MRDNELTCVCTPSLLLLPYRPSYVPKYHTWMSDPALLEATSSEPLTLEEEYAAQASWVEDPSKCTFIVFDRAQHGQAAQVHLGDGCTTAGMCGDVNLFLLDALSVAQDYFGGQQQQQQGARAAEVMVMIADVAYRRRGLAVEAVKGMLWYGLHTLGITRFVAKIGEGNLPSLTLFTEKLGFRVAKRVPAFAEVHLVWESSGGGGGEDGWGVTLLPCSPPSTDSSTKQH